MSSPSSSPPVKRICLEESSSFTKVPSGQDAEQRRIALLAIFGNTPCLPCLCRVPENYRMTDELQVPTRCQALDDVDGQLIPCNMELSANSPMLVRSHIRVRFSVMCEKHMFRLRLHQNCPTCGIFCTKGRFNKCDETNPPHYFHESCMNEMFQCPHCLSTSFDAIDIDHTSDFSYRGPCGTRMMTLTNKVQRLLQFPNEPFISQHSYRLPDSDQYIIAAHLSNSADRELVRKAMTSLDTSVTSNIDSLERSVLQNDLRGVITCIAGGINPNERFTSGLTPLQYAAANGRFLICFVLLSLGADVDAVDETGQTSLMMAVENRHQTVCDLLIRFGKADLSKRNSENDTVLHIAAKKGDPEILDMIAFRADSVMNEQDNGGWTALMWAAEHSGEDIVGKLLDLGAKCNIVDKEGNIALHWAAMHGSVGVGALLISHGDKGDVDRQNKRGCTPMTIACRESHFAFVELLLTHGADPRIADSRNRKPSDYIEKNVTDEASLHILLQLSERCKTLVDSDAPFVTKGLLDYDLSRGRERLPIAVYNDEDDQRVPVDFCYITSLHETGTATAVSRAISPIWSCRCVNGCSDGSTMCRCRVTNGCIWYDQEGRLLKNFFDLEERPQYIYECNWACRCPPSCNNRVVQKGISYAGEVVSEKQAEETEEDSYLFDLIDVGEPVQDRNSRACCIDAFRFGNVSRFINHGCEANLFTQKVFYDHVDTRAPHVAFFAQKDINKDDELTFDYGPNFWGVKGKYFTCKCHSSKCLYDSDKIDALVAQFDADEEQSKSESFYQNSFRTDQNGSGIRD